MEQGIDIGRTEERVNIARNMKKKEFDIALISEATGLTAEKNERLE
ncbi:MAG: hypothetical protein FWH27_11375 [Planctomycetaceae bacterium]|nr:hypothetical protein [Planctomycetaceae bacterium]